MRAARERSVDGPARVGDYKIINEKGRKEKEEKKKSRPVTESKMRDVCVVVEAKRGLPGSGLVVTGCQVEWLCWSRKAAAW